MTCVRPVNERWSRKRGSLLPFLGALLLLALPLSLPAQTRLNFDNAPLSTVLRSLAATIGLNVVMSDIPDKRISFSTAAPVSAAQIPGILESLLEGNGLVLVRQGTVAQIVPAERAPATGEVKVGMEISDPPPLGIVSQLVPLTSIRADEAAAALRQVASPTARIEAVTRSNALLITDRGSNVAKYLELLKRLDERPQGEAGLRTYVVPLRYASAQDLAASLGQLFGVTVAAGPSNSLDDRALSRSLGNFRERESQTFQMRRDVTAPVSTPQRAATPTESGPVQPGALVGQTTVVPNPPTNSLIIRTAPPNYPLLKETVDALDIRPAQVLFEVTVAEITLGAGNEFGVDWSAFGRDGGVSLGNPNADSGGPGQFVARLLSLKDNVDVRAVLRAIASNSNVRVLSTPEILATNNREARILVGSKVPFIASTRLGNDVAVDRNVQYEDVGTQLTLIPTVNQDDYVTVQLLQEVSTLTNQTVAAALNAPVISTREASTRAVIRDGQTVVIGGLIGDSREDSESGVPILKDIPLLGALFKNKRITTTRTELAIFVTPYIVRADEDADAIRERVRRRMNTRVPGTLPDSGGVRPPGF